MHRNTKKRLKRRTRKRHRLGRNQTNGIKPKRYGCKPMKSKTLWSQTEKKFKPINKQAVRIMFPAKGLNCPPEEEKQPVIVGTMGHRLAAEAKAESDARRARIAAYEKEEAERQIKRKENKIKAREQRKIAKAQKGFSPNKVMERYLRKMQKKFGKSGWTAPAKLMAGGPIPKKP